MFLWFMSDDRITRSAQVKQGNADDLRMFVSMSPIFPLEESLTNTSVKKFTIEQKKMFFYARNDTIRKYPSWQKKAYCDKKT